MFEKLLNKSNQARSETHRIKMLAPCTVGGYFNYIPFKIG